MNNMKNITGLSANLLAQINSLKNALGEIESADVANEESHSTGAGMRMLLYSHDTFGLGHLQRCLKISRALISHYPDLSILLVTGSPVVHRYQLPPGVDYVKLPAVRKVGPEKYEARTLGTSYRRILNIRTNILLQTIQDYNPHLLLVDHSPIGMKGEMLPALEWLKKSNASCTKLLGLRDIIDAPEKVIDLWKQQGTYEVLQELYDYIVVYGSSEVYNPITAYQFSSDLEQKTYFCNYISPFSRNGHNNGSKKKKVNKKHQVVVTIGGGDGAGEVVIGTFLKMLRKNLEKVNFDSVIITGPFLSVELFKKFRKESLGLPVTLRQFIPGTSSLFKQCDLVVSTGGYNTVTELLGFARRALIIPRVLHRQEQLIRAQRLSEMGLLTFLHPDKVTPQLLYKIIISLLKSTREPLTEAREKKLIKFDGTDRLADFCGKLFIAQTKKQEVIND